MANGKVALLKRFLVCTYQFRLLVWASRYGTLPGNLNN